MPKDVFEEKAVTLAEVKEILKKRESESTELTYVQQVTLDYANKFSQISVEDTLKLKEELIKRFGLSEKIAIQIVSLYTPLTHPSELDIILEKEPITLTPEQKNDVIVLIHSFIEKI
ncbi:MAG TPA: RNA polymerase Rpb4 family protein [Candidatus Deferrimicrobium sp.]|nr:RNA polymerase Rpb4 family protein [Candidatus Deferrimicrobium sp.]